MTTEVDVNLIENAVKFINEKITETYYKGSIEVGEYLLKQFFNDDIELASSRNPYKNDSYNTLCKHEKLNVHPSTLSIIVRVASQERLFKQHKIKTDKLNYSQKAELIKVDNVDKKIDLAKQCINKSITIKELKEMVYNVRKELKDDTEAKTITPSVFVKKYLADAEHILNASKLLDFDIDNLTKIDNDKLQNLKTKTDELLDNIKILAKKYTKIKSKLENLKKTDDSTPVT